jgi:hypothetical protein
MKKIIFFIFLFLIGNHAETRAEFSKVGTAAAQFLKIGVGARAMGMGETFAAVANDASTLFWNPAGMTNLSGISLIVSHSEWFADLSHDYAGFSFSWGNRNALGVSAIALNTPEQEVTTITQPEGAGIYYDVGDIALGLSYARALTDRFSTGVTVKYIQQNAFNETASTIAFDLGTYLRTGFHGLTIGMCLSNFGGRLQLDGRDLIAKSDINPELAGNFEVDSRLKTEAWPLPLNFRVGVALNVLGALFPAEQNRLTLALDGNHPKDNVERVNFGAEYAWKETLFARAGYKLNYDAEKWAFGGGLKFKVSRQLFALDYALVDFGELGKVSRFSLELHF